MKPMNGNDAVSRLGPATLAERVMSGGTASDRIRTWTLALVAILLAGCSLLPALPVAKTEAHTLQGSLELLGGSSNWSLDGDVCSGKGGFADVAGGAGIAITDAAGTLIALGNLGRGEVGRPKDVCLFGIQVTAIPASAFYQIEIGRRPVLRYSRADMDAFGWSIDLTLGP